MSDKPVSTSYLVDAGCCVVAYKDEDGLYHCSALKEIDGRTIQVHGTSTEHITLAIKAAWVKWKNLKY